MWYAHLNISLEAACESIEEAWRPRTFPVKMRPTQPFYVMTTDIWNGISKHNDVLLFQMHTLI